MTKPAGLFQRIQSLGSGVLLRLVLRHLMAIAQELRATNQHLAALTRAIERLVPPPPDQADLAPPTDVKEERLLYVRDDSFLDQMYAFRDQLTAERMGEIPDIEEVVEEWERRERDRDAAGAPPMRQSPPR